MLRLLDILSFFFFNDTATTEIYTLSLHDALPICIAQRDRAPGAAGCRRESHLVGVHRSLAGSLHAEILLEHLERSEEHTSELQSPCNLVCRLLLEKKKKTVSQTLLASRQDMQKLC